MPGPEHVGHPATLMSEIESGQRIAILPAAVADGIAAGERCPADGDVLGNDGERQRDDREIAGRVAVQVAQDALGRQAVDGRLDFIEAAHAAQVVPVRRQRARPR